MTAKYTFQQSELAGYCGYKYQIARDSAPLDYGSVIELWRDNDDFRTQFVATLADAPFDAFRWETPPVTKNSLSQPFEFVLIDDPWLDVAADARPFRNYFKSASQDGVVTFENLGGDAFLIVPVPVHENVNYSHLAAFTRQAARHQNHALWRAVGYAMQQRLGQKPIWLNTAGGGVAWLHVRLDSRPKYYRYRPYRDKV